MDQMLRLHDRSMDMDFGTLWICHNDDLSMKSKQRFVGSPLTRLSDRGYLVIVAEDNFDDICMDNLHSVPQVHINLPGGPLHGRMIRPQFKSFDALVIYEG